MPQDFRKYMSPDFAAAPPPELQWMPMEQDQTAGNMGSIVDQLKQRQSRNASLAAPDGNLPYVGNGMPEGPSGMPTAGVAKPEGMVDKLAGGMKGSL